jgi:hypothetical protein
MGREADKTTAGPLISHSLPEKAHGGIASESHAHMGEHGRRLVDKHSSVAMQPQQQPIIAATLNDLRLGA